MLFHLPVILFHTPRPLPFFIVYYVLLPLCSPCQAQGCLSVNICFLSSCAQHPEVDV